MGFKAQTHMSSWQPFHTGRKVKGNLSRSSSKESLLPKRRRSGVEEVMLSASSASKVVGYLLALAVVTWVRFSLDTVAPVLSRKLLRTMY